ncbi:NUDIX domain-containing protein [Tautonia marina]|uniref:NUDIX domain-containing protein n=1 Tax=Tautonia marina TaxID=2653855 RepID=UPI001260D99D|nr:NUDIX hydrolase [Tautonia marina]
MTQSYCYDFPRPAVTVDTVAFAVDRSALRVLMIRRGQPPFEGQWALPGGFLDLDEAAEPAARRELFEETGIEVQPSLPFEPLGFYSAPGRDPRGRTISLAYATVLPPPPPEPSGGDDAAEASWIIADSPDRPLAFDHAQILNDALEWLRKGVEAGPLGLALLPDPFNRDDARSMFHAVGLPLRHSARWLGRCAKELWIEPVEGDSQRYRPKR